MLGRNKDVCKPFMKIEDKRTPSLGRWLCCVEAFYAGI